MMKRAVIIGAIILCALIGAALILESPELGVKAANTWLRSVGGSADTNQFLQVMKGATNSYLTLGALLLGGALFGFFFNARDLLEPQVSTNS